MRFFEMRDQDGEKIGVETSLRAARTTARAWITEPGDVAQIMAIDIPTPITKEVIRRILSGWGYSEETEVVEEWEFDEAKGKAVKSEAVEDDEDDGDITFTRTETGWITERTKREDD